MVLAGLLALLAPVGGAAQDRSEPDGSTAIRIPYDVAVRVWRDEQPGDEPRLHASARFVPTGDAQPWAEVELLDLGLRFAGGVWAPQESAVEPLADGAFEVRAAGDPDSADGASVAAGVSVVPVVSLRTSAGVRDVVLPGSVVERID